MIYKIGLPYKISEVFYLDVVIAGYEKRLSEATNNKQLKFIIERLENLNQSYLKICN